MRGVRPLASHNGPQWLQAGGDRNQIAGARLWCVACPLTGRHRSPTPTFHAPWPPGMTFSWSSGRVSWLIFDGRPEAGLVSHASCRSDLACGS